jgi:hypothetical protein
MDRKLILPFILTGVAITFLGILDRDYQLERLADSIREGLEPIFLLFIVGLLLVGVVWFVLNLMSRLTRSNRQAVLNLPSLLNRQFPSHQIPLSPQTEDRATSGAISTASTLCGEGIARRMIAMRCG